MQSSTLRHLRQEHHHQGSGQIQKQQISATEAQLPLPTAPPSSSKLDTPQGRQGADMLSPHSVVPLKNINFWSRQTREGHFWAKMRQRHSCRDTSLGCTTSPTVLQETKIRPHLLPCSETGPVSVSVTNSWGAYNCTSSTGFRAEPPVQLGKWGDPIRKQAQWPYAGYRRLLLLSRTGSLGPAQRVQAPAWRPPSAHSWGTLGLVHACHFSPPVCQPVSLGHPLPLPTCSGSG